MTRENNSSLFFCRRQQWGHRVRGHRLTADWPPDTVCVCVCLLMRVIRGRRAGTRTAADGLKR